jgi:hypothetical protein
VKKKGKKGRAIKKQSNFFTGLKNWMDNLPTPEPGALNNYLLTPGLGNPHASSLSPLSHSPL